MGKLRSEKGLRVNVYGTQALSDSSNGGLSSIYKVLHLMDYEGGVELDPSIRVFEPAYLDQRIIIVERTVCGKPYFTAYPYVEEGKKKPHFMFGGAFVYSSDGRFPCTYPVPLHDRVE